MLFFRSEAALDEWLAARGAPRGAILTLSQLWALSRRWYRDRLSPDYRGRTMEEVQEIFREAGLISEFWQAA